MSVTVPSSRDVELAVLAACLMSVEALHHAAHTVRLKPEHFADRRRGDVYAGMVDLAADGCVVDPVALEQRMTDRGTPVPAADIDALAGATFTVSNIDRYCRDVVKLATWRQRHTAAQAAVTAVETLDVDRFDRAIHEANTAAQDRLDGDWATGPDQAAAFNRTLNGEFVKRWTWGFAKLDRLSRGGARRGHLTFVAGPTSHGKSVFVDMALEAMGDHGANVGLFINEMTKDERTERFIARRALIDLEQIQAATAGGHTLPPHLREKAMEAARTNPVAIRECSGWTVTDICREARRRDLDVVCLDIIQRLAHKGDNRTRQLEAASQQFDELAKDGRHVIVVGHTNRSRAAPDGRVPVPVLSDIKDAAALAHDADNVLFVWREQDPQTLRPVDTGVVNLAKCRGGELGALKVRLDGPHQRFLPIDDRHLEVAA